ncbi:tubulin polyglutamylase TTLL5 isoform X1 [Silurus asotus]|uniref:Tubulin polyglutamylase TTLL5 isoform X1 n=1 Tax=Silurus asotus TaxID=30991 RepID=A0AAD5ANU4_SILAS|nr:tubulin polyglutamylase TTLL5 isoform X1 [Silurus asotus]
MADSDGIKITKYCALGRKAQPSRECRWEDTSHSKGESDGKCQSGYDLATGTTLQPTLGSYQLQFTIQQLQQQKLQSRKLLDQSRSRHQAMLNGHTLVPGAIPRNPVPTSCSLQVTSHSQTSMKQTTRQRDSNPPETLVPTQGSTTLIPKPPSSTLLDTLSCKTSTQKTNKQAPNEAPCGNGLSSRQKVVHDTTCGKTDVCSKEENRRTFPTTERLKSEDA